MRFSGRAYDEREPTGLTPLPDIDGRYQVAFSKLTRKGDTFAQWKRGITEVATSQNVIVKLGWPAMTFHMFDFYARKKPLSSTDLETARRPHGNMHRDLWCRTRLWRVGRRG